jgi:hypothetical protein
MSKARLYALDPIQQLLRELTEIFSVSLVARGSIANREIDAVLIGYGITSFLSDTSES